MDGFEALGASFGAGAGGYVGGVDALAVGEELGGVLVAGAGFFVLGGALGVGGCGGGGFCSCFGADADECAVFGAAAWGEVCDGAGVVEFGEGAAVVFSGGFAVVEVANELFTASDEGC